MKTLNLVKNDQWLEPYEKIIYQRYQKAKQKEDVLTGGKNGLAGFASGHLYFGVHRTNDGWTLREWAPNATGIFLLGDFNHWEKI